MSSEGPKSGFAFVIDTDSYAGNFEREMTAHITGVIGECEVGEEFIDEDFPFPGVENVEQVSDDNGCYRPTSCWPSKSGGYNSVAIFFRNKPTPEDIEFMKSRSLTFNSEWENETWRQGKPIKILGYRLIEFKSTETEETC